MLAASSFVEDFRRLNVALTRARRLCIAFGDCHTLEAAGGDLAALVEHAAGAGVLVTQCQ